MRTNASTLAATWRFAAARGWPFLVDFMLFPPPGGDAQYPERLDGDELAAVLAECREFLQPADPERRDTVSLHDVGRTLFAVDRRQRARYRLQ